MASKPTILRFKFDDFESLSSERDDCHARTKRVTDESAWRLGIYPGGRFHDVNGDASDDIDDEEKLISLFLCNMKGGDITATVALIVRDAIGSVYMCHSTNTLRTFRARGVSFGSDGLLKRSDILDKENNVLVDGALIVDVVIQLAKGEKDLFYPSNPHLKNMLTFLENGDDADVSFKVGDTTIAAHKLILKMNAPILHSFCPKGGNAPVSIKDTTPKVFHLVLRYIYGGGASEAIDALNSYDDDDDENTRHRLGRELIEAADRYGVIGLKLAVETALVKRCVVDMENAVDWILFADAKTCPLLKEHATNYFSVMAKDIIKSETWKKLKESPDLMEEMIFAMSNTPENDCFDQTSKMSVDELRKELNEMGLDVDGSKEMLVSRLDESNANKRQRTE